MIYTSYFANVKKLPDNIIPIAICIRPPEGYRGLWYPRLAPDYEILKRWRRDHDEKDYIKLFKRSVLDNQSVYNVLWDIERMLPARVRQGLQSSIETSPDWHVALICYEKSEDFCHRHLVADWFKRNGIECDEWENKGG